MSEADKDRTTEKELWGWWMYNFAIEPTAVTVLVLFMPMLLDGLPRAVGHIRGDPATPCGILESDTRPCVLFHVGALEINTSSFAYYTIALSVLLQAVVFMSLGSLADYGRLRRRFLRISTWLGAALTVSVMLATRPHMYWLTAVLFILINICVGAGTVFYNAYLPLLAASHPHCNETKADGEQQAARKSKEEVSNWISTRGFAVGYVSALVTLVACAAFMLYRGSTFWNMGLCIAFCGVWWLAASLFSLFALRARTGPPLPPGTNYITVSWSKLLDTFRKTRQLPTTFWYLASYFLFSDGYGTLCSVAVIFARSEMGVPYVDMMKAMILAPVCSLLGNYFFFGVQRVFRLRTKTMILLLLGLLSVIPLYGSLGLVSTAVGLRNKWEIYLFTTYYGFLVGAIQSFSRVMFAEFIPPGDESEFFSLYAMTDKGSAALGPALQSLVSDWTSDQRYGLLVLSLFLIVPIPMIAFMVDADKGKADAQSFHARIRAAH